MSRSRALLTPSFRKVVRKVPTGTRAFVGIYKYLKPWFSEGVGKNEQLQLLVGGDVVHVVAERVV